MIISRAEHRQGKEDIAQKKMMKEKKASEDECKEYDRVQGVLRAWDALASKAPILLAEHTPDAAVAALQTVANIKVYLEMKTKEKPKSQLKKEEAIEGVKAAASKPIALREGNVPDGYAEWKEKEHERLQLGAAPNAAPLALTLAPTAIAGTPAAVAESPTRAGKRKAAAMMMEMAEKSTPNTRAVFRAQAEAILGPQ